MIAVAGYHAVVCDAFICNGRWRPSCSARLQKTPKWLNAKIIVTQSRYNAIQTFFSSFYTLLCLVRDAILTDIFLFNFETTQCKYHFDTNFV